MIHIHPREMVVMRFGRLKSVARGRLQCLFRLFVSLLLVVTSVAASTVKAPVTFKLTVMGEHDRLCRDIMVTVRHSRIATANDGDLRDALINISGNIFTSPRMRDLAWKAVASTSKEAIADQFFRLANPPRDTRLYTEARDAFDADVRTLVNAKSLDVSSVELGTSPRSMNAVEINRRMGNKDSLLGLYFPLSELIVGEEAEAVPLKIPVRGKIFTFDGDLMVFTVPLGKWERENSSGDEFTLLSFDLVDTSGKPFVDYACEIRVNRSTSH